MYNPSRFKSEDVNAAFELMDRHPFATLISVNTSTATTPEISQIPLTTVRNGDSLEIIGHMSRANPHSRTLAGSAIAVFHGPQAYITPKWYVGHDVPTWNYVTVHAKGEIEPIDTRDGIISCLETLTAHVERHWPSGWSFAMPDDMTGDALAKHIVGFRMRVSEFSFKKKLSQNRNPEDRAGVMRGLASSRRDDNSRFVLAEMLKIYSRDGQPSDSGD